MHRNPQLDIDIKWPTTDKKSGASSAIFCLYLNKYITLDGIYSDEEMDWFDREEKRWKESLTDDHWYDKIPEAKKFAEAGIIQAKADLNTADDVEKECEDIIYRKSSKETEWFWRLIADELLVKPWRKGKDAFIKKSSFLLTHKKSTYSIEAAKKYPIKDLIKVSRANTAQCPWCMDQGKDDLHYYPKNNTVYCFACSKAGDAIDVCRQVYGLTFTEAIKKLS